MAQKDSLLNIILNIVKQGSGDKEATQGMSDLDAQLDQTTTSLMGSVLGFTTLSGAILAGAAVLNQSVDAAADLETTEARLGATIQSTGRSSEASLPQIQALADSMKGIFNRDDIETAANALMKYMDIPTAQIPSDLVLIENMAAAGAGGATTMAQAADVLGNALETGRVRGLGFSRELTNEISLMATHGDTAQMDALILDQLSQKFGGQYAADLDTYHGMQAEVNTAWSDFKDEIGAALIPFMEFVDAGLPMMIELLGAALTNWNSLGDIILEVDDILHGDFPGAAAELRKALDQGSAGANELAKSTMAADTELDDFKAKTDSATQATAALLKAVEDKSSWEQSYTNAKTAADQTASVMKLLGADIQGLGIQGADVWEGFLAATGQISPAAEKQFVQIENDYNTVKNMLAAGIDATIVVKWLESVTGAGPVAPDKGETDSTSAASGSGGKITLAPWASAADKAYAAAHPAQYAPPQAAGGDYLVNEPTTFLAGEAGPERATFTPLNGGGGAAGVVITNNFNITGSDPRAIAEEVKKVIMAQMAMQGVKTRIT